MKKATDKQARKASRQLRDLKKNKRNNWMVKE